MDQDITTPAYLKDLHCHSPHVRRLARDVNILFKQWNDLHLVTLVESEARQEKKLFVWSWQEGQNLKYRYTYDLQTLYPCSLSSTAMFLYKKYLVLMPGQVVGNYRSMIRVHNLASIDMPLIYKHDLQGPERSVREMCDSKVEPSHLHLVGDKALALCRTPEFSVFVFGLPDCTVPLKRLEVLGNLIRPLPDLLNLWSRKTVPARSNLFYIKKSFWTKGATGIFLVDKNYYREEYFIPQRLLCIDLGEIVGQDGHKLFLGSLNNDRFKIIDIQMVDERRFVCYLSDKSIRICNIDFRSGNLSFSSCIPPFSDAITDYSQNSVVAVSDNGKSFAVIRHYYKAMEVAVFESKGLTEKRFSITLRHAQCKLPFPVNLAMAIDDHFLCISDLRKILVYNARERGQFVGVVALPKHYSSYDRDRIEAGGISIADGVIVVNVSSLKNSRKKFPATFDIVKFW